MSDDLVGHMTKLIAVGLDRIEQLTAELADAEALIEAQAKDHASNNIRFAEAEHRAKTAEAERDRLREALQLYAEPCDATETSPCGYTGNMCCRTAREALKGESHE